MSGRDDPARPTPAELYGLASALPPDAVQAARWLTDAAVGIAEQSDSSIIRDLREVIAKAMDLAETLP